MLRAERDGLPSAPRPRRRGPPAAARARAGRRAPVGRPRSGVRRRARLGREGLARARGARARRRRLGAGGRRAFAQRHVRGRRARDRPAPAARRRPRALRRDDADLPGPRGHRRRDRPGRGDALAGRSDADAAQGAGRARTARCGRAAAWRCRPPTARSREELVLSVEAVKTHMRALFDKFEVEDLPHNQKRTRLAELALQAGVVVRSRLAAGEPGEHGGAREAPARRRCGGREARRPRPSPRGPPRAPATSSDSCASNSTSGGSAGRTDACPTVSASLPSSTTTRLRPRPCRGGARSAPSPGPSLAAAACARRRSSFSASSGGRRTKSGRSSVIGYQ